MFKEKFSREKDPSYFGHGTSLEQFFVQNHDFDRNNNNNNNNNNMNNIKGSIRQDDDVVAAKNRLIDAYKSAIFDKNQLATINSQLADDSYGASIIGEEMVG